MKMQKYVWIVFGVLFLVVISYVIFVREEGEFKSPQQTHVFTDGDLNIELIYGSPSKRGREIFGALVPYDKVWRTGANEATELHTNKDLDFNGQLLKAGNYSVWAQPGKEAWKVIINSHLPSWGIDKDGAVARVPENDVMTVGGPTRVVEGVTEMFTMTIQKADSSYNLVFDWDKTKVEIPFTQK